MRSWTLYESRVTNELFHSRFLCMVTHSFNLKGCNHIIITIITLIKILDCRYTSILLPRPRIFSLSLSLYFTTIFTFQQLMIITTFSPCLSLPVEEPLISLFRATLCNNGEKPSYSSGHWRGGYHLFSHCITSFSILFAFLAAEKTW